MKKILFRKLLLDCFIFLLISLISTSVIIWVFQAVNFLDIIVEDGRDFKVYFNYTLLNFPKIISKLLPFAAFFSFCYVLNRYELNNELIIFWNFGVHKIQLINFFFIISIILTITQLILTTLLVPKSQNYSRSLIRNSSVDFFESFVKPKKFNDNIKGLTIYADEKNKDGSLKNIYLKKDGENNKYQITIAKTGEFKTINKSKILVLFDGQTLNLNNGKITKFNFSKSDFILSTLDSDVIIQDKIQETSTHNLINCLRKYFHTDLSPIMDAPKFINKNCTYENLENIFKELYKRFIIPFYLPILILASLLLILKSKENVNFNKYKFWIFIFGMIIIIYSESSLKFIGRSFHENYKFMVTPILGMIFLYIYFKIKLLNKVKN
jgi:lipopolysaccharide export system permease protein